jgi:hypothetical protein
MVEPADAQEAPKWDHGCDTGLFGTTAQTFIRKCVGLVDAASVVLIDSCQGETNDSSNRDVLDPLCRSDQDNRNKRKQGGVLQFPANDGLQDDVSALSANTLEEMERLQRMMVEQAIRPPRPFDESNAPYPGQQLRPPSTPKGVTWASFPIERSPSDQDQSIGVATSGSSSAPDEPNCTEKNRAWHGNRKVESFLAQVEAPKKR